MLNNFNDKEAAKIFGGEFSKKLPTDIQKAARRKLFYLHAATNLEDLKVPPGNRLEQLTGDRIGQYSIRINDQWRICFEWDNDTAYNVEIIDYH